MTQAYRLVVMLTPW